nr:MAG TPA: hypothetical protein [Caudoviricetes sp.]
MILYAIKVVDHIRNVIVIRYLIVFVIIYS